MQEITQAVAAAIIMAKLNSPSNMTNYRVPPKEPLPAPIVQVVKPPAPRVVLPPVNCCSQYVIPLPETRIRIVK
jgi:hypothetical protein